MDELKEIEQLIKKMKTSGDFYKYVLQRTPYGKSNLHEYFHKSTTSPDTDYYKALEMKKILRSQEISEFGKLASWFLSSLAQTFS